MDVSQTSVQKDKAQKYLSSKLYIRLINLIVYHCSSQKFMWNIVLNWIFGNLQNFVSSKTGHPMVPYN